MSRSYKKAIIKDKGEWNYNKIVRRVTKQIVRSFKNKWKDVVSKDLDLSNRTENLEQDIPNSREIVNDYDYCDFIIDWEYTLRDPKQTIKNRRK